MPRGDSPARNPRWFWIPARVLFFTFLCTLLAFAVTLLLGILGVIAGARMRGGTPNLTIAYRDVAVPAALMVAGIVLVSSIFMEVRHYRQSQILAKLERSGSSGYAKHPQGV